MNPNLTPEQTRLMLQLAQGDELHEGILTAYREFFASVEKLTHERAVAAIGKIGGALPAKARAALDELEAVIAADSINHAAAGYLLGLHVAGCRPSPVEATI